MPNLTTTEKTHIIEMLACFETPTEVQQQVQKLYGKSLSLPQILYYDATSQQSKNLAADLRELFTTTRKRFTEEVGRIPIANQTYRLRELQRLYERNRDRSPVVAAAILKQAAMESGGLFTNKRDVTSGGETVGVIGYQIIPPALDKCSAFSTGCTGDLVMSPSGYLESRDA